MNKEQVLRLIDEAARDGRSELDLGVILKEERSWLRTFVGLGTFTELPPEIGRLTNLTKLNLSSNGLSALPPEIGRLTNLTVLNLGENKLSALPPEIGRLTNLTKLNLQYNKLSALPPEIGRLTNLTELNLRSNGLSALPPEIGRLTNLAELNLGENRVLSALPPEIGRLTNLTVLNLGENKLSALPPEIGRLTNLTKLNLQYNKLSALPPEIGRLTNLTELNLRSNGLSALPPEIGRLTNLTVLNLGENKLSALPPEIGRLTNLTELNLSGNELSALPPEIGRLTNLTVLNLVENKLSTLPPEIGRLTNLTRLYLRENRLRALPPEIGLLTNLADLNLNTNDLHVPPPSIVDKGIPAILAYLRGLLQSAQEVWRAKLVIVGEPRAGKTSLLRRLREDRFSLDENSTHGIEKHSLKLRHPTRDQEMELIAWDFGGQHIYHATHRFFLTDGAIFLLVWDSSRDADLAGKLEYWLENIRARAPKARVVLVATHAEGRAADLRDDLDVRYPGMIVGRFPVSNKNEIDPRRTALLERLGTLAEELPLMGKPWPTAWLNAAEALAHRTEDHLSPGRTRKELARFGVNDDSAANTLLDWLHERGDILYFRQDSELNNIVMLKPDRVSELISCVLDNTHVRDSGGLFTLEDRQLVWRDIDEPVREHLLRIMEQFDLSYRTGAELKSPSLVVDCLPLRPPTYEEVWETAGKVEGARELALTFELNGSGGERLKILPPGIPGWFIARTHRFSTGTHWRYGTLLADTPKREHLALIRAEEGRVLLVVRGPHPIGFFTELTNVLDDTLQRYPGLEIRRAVPCPGHNGSRCPYQFPYERLLELDTRGQSDIECGVSGALLPVRRLLYGMDEAVSDGRSPWQADWEARQAAANETLVAEIRAVREGTADIRRLQTKYHVQTAAGLQKLLDGEEYRRRLAKEQDRIFACVMELKERVDAQSSSQAPPPNWQQEMQRLHEELLRNRKAFQEEFTKLHRRDQAVLDAKLPRTFALRPAGGNRWWKEKLFGQAWELQLFCEQPGAWHPQEKGRYTIQQPPGWMRKMAPYLRYLCWGLRVSLPVVGVVLPVAGLVSAATEFTTGAELTEQAKDFANYLKSMEELTDLLASAASTDTEISAIASTEVTEQGDGEILRDYWKLLNDLDGSLRPGGLQPVLPGNACLWLCDHHANQNRP